MSGVTHRDGPHWLGTLRVFLGVSAIAHVIWESAQLPFYTVWQSGTWRELAFAVLHCSAGDVLIAAATLLLALLLFGNERWPMDGAHRVGAAMLGFGIAYVIFSEWLNVTVRKSWAYSDLMPVLPVTGTGLLPLLQWIIVPLIAMRLSLPRHGAGD